MKSIPQSIETVKFLSHPVRGAWIEIGFSLDIGGAVNGRTP